MNQQMIEAMTEEEYSFYLAHGVTNDAQTYNYKKCWMSTYTQM